MAERDHTSASRKAAQSFPLTHRQQKATQRPHPPRRKAQKLQQTPKAQKAQKARRTLKTTARPVIAAPAPTPRARRAPRAPRQKSTERQAQATPSGGPAITLPERSATQARQGRKLRPAPNVRAVAPNTKPATSPATKPRIADEVETRLELASAALATSAAAAPSATLSEAVVEAVVEAPAATPDETTVAPEDAPTPRKLPTLAVMAALAPRAEPVETASGPLGEPTRAPTGEALDNALDEGAPETLVALATEAADATPSATSAPEALETSAALTPPDAAAADDQADDAERADPPASDDAATPTRRRDHALEHALWWIRAARHRAAPETRPLADRLAPHVGVGGDDGGEIDAERAAAPHDGARLTSASAAADSLLATQRGDLRDPGDRRRLGRRHAGHGQRVHEPRLARAARDASDASETSADLSGELFIQRRRALGARQRMLAAHSPRAVVLSWTAGGHATIASVAAVIAVIAALRSDAGAVALTVFGWALALAVIAGVSAAAGYLCAQIGRPQLATLALALGQLCALGWALALLGPRAALLALAPASVALALRGSGRLGAVVTALLWMSLFIVAEALTLSGALTAALPLAGVAAALVDVALPLVGLWLVVSVLISLYSSRMQVAARGRAIEHVALRAEDQLALLRAQLEDDADALRQTLAQALRGEEPERVEAHGALSVVASALNDLADRLVDLRYDRAERKRLEAAIRRLTQVMERAWLGLSWSWPDATDTLLDDLLALLRTPPPADMPDQLDETTPTGRVVAPHLFRGWQPPEPSQPGAPSMPSLPSFPSLWPSDPDAGLTDPLEMELPPSPRWRGPDSLYDTPQRPDGADH